MSNRAKKLISDLFMHRDSRSGLALTTGYSQQDVKGIINFLTDLGFVRCVGGCGLELTEPGRNFFVEFIDPIPCIRSLNDPQYNARRGSE